MNNEIRNELLMLLQMEKQTDKKERKLRLEWLLERFEYDIKDKLKELYYQKQQLDNNLEVLEYVKEELKKY
jgi:hypothetical protein